MTSKSWYSIVDYIFIGETSYNISLSVDSSVNADCPSKEAILKKLEPWPISVTAWPASETQIHYALDCSDITRLK